MIPSKFKRSESRRSSILKPCKPCKPRQPLQNINFDSSSNENSPAASKIKRRVSFAEKKHVKEFCLSTEHGTVWDNTYEEHEFSLKGSFDQKVEVESKENASLDVLTNDHIHCHSESTSCYPNVCLVTTQLSQNQEALSTVTKTNEEDTMCHLDFVSPVKSTQLSNISQLGYAALSNTSKDTVSSGIIACNSIEHEEYMKLATKESQSQTVRTSISPTSKNVKSSNITIYRDSDEEDYDHHDHVTMDYFKSCSNNINSELDKTRVQDQSIELTTPISVFLSPLLMHTEKQKHNNINNLDTTYTTCNNVSMEITTPISTKSVASNLGISKQIPTILQNCENTRWDAANDATDVNYAVNSMVTSIVQPFTDVMDTDVCRSNNIALNAPIEMISTPSKLYERSACNENTVECNNLRKDQTDKTEIFNDVPMEMTKPVCTTLSSNVYNKENFTLLDKPIPRDDRTMFFHNVSMEMTKTISTESKREITDTNTCKSLSEENAHSEKDVNISTCFNEGTKILCKSMEFTEAVPVSLEYENIFHAAHVAQPVNKNTCKEYKTDRTECFNDASMERTKSINILPLNIDKDNSKIDKLKSKDDETMLFHNVSMEMTTAVSSRNQNKIIQPNACKLISKDKTYGEKETNASICFNEGTKILCKSMEFTEAVPVSLEYENIFHAAHVAQPVNKSTCKEYKTDRTECFNDTSMERTKSINILPLNIDKDNSKIDKTISKDDETMLFHNVSMEMTTAVSSRNQNKIIQPNTCKLISKDKTYGEKETNASTCFNEGTKILCKSMEFTEAVPVSLEYENIFHAAHVAQPVNKNTCKEYKTDRTECFNDASMERTKSINILSLNIDKDNSKIDKLKSKDDETMLFHNVSMEMTTAVSSRNQNKIIQPSASKLISKDKTYGEKETNASICFNEGTKILCKSMEFTEAVPVSLEYENKFHAAHVAQPVNKSTCKEYKTDRTECFNDTSMERTKSIDILPLNIDKDNSKIDESISKDDETMLFHNVPMEMTTAVSSRNEIIQPINYKLISKDKTYGEKETNASICFNEGTKILCKSMEFTKVIPISLHDERTSDTTTQSTFSQTLSKTTVPAENSTGITFQQTDPNETIQDITMMITAMPSTLQLQDVKVTLTENSNISNNEFQYLRRNNNSTNSDTDTTEETFTISRGIVETENIRDNKLSNVIVTPLHNLDHSFDANFDDANNKEKISDYSGSGSYPKRVDSSFIQVQSSQENDVHSFLNADANYINENERNECCVKDYTQVSDSNLEDNLDEISRHNFSSLPKKLENFFLENSLVELQSINPPSFVCLDSEEENSSHEIQSKLESSTITATPIDNTCNQLRINKVTDSKCLKEKLIHIEKDQAEDCHRSNVIDKTEDNWETTCQTTKNVNDESIAKTAKNGKALTLQDINHCTSLIIKEIQVTDEDQVEEEKETRVNKNAKLQNDIEEEEQHSANKRQKTEMCSNHLEGTAIENRIDFEECRKNLNNEVKQSVEQKNDGATKRLVTAQYIDMNEDVKNGSLIEQDSFLILSQKLETHAAREDCIWNVYYKNIDKKMIVFGFMSDSLLIATFLSCNFNSSEENLVKEIKIISRISDDAGVLIKIVHKLILEKINVEMLMNVYRTHRDILPMLNFISQDVKLTMDFMFDLRRLDDLNQMEIVHDEISFISRSKQMDIILRVTIKVKPFDKLTSDDISIRFLLGSVKKTDVKNLIKNVKRDCKFLRRYMNDVKDYIDIMEETLK